MFENELVRVLEYRDEPGERTTPHVHPNSVVWLAAQRHSGENIGRTPTHTIFVELKGAAAGSAADGVLGPDL